MSLLLVAVVLLVALVVLVALRSTPNGAAAIQAAQPETSGQLSRINPATGLPMILGEPYGFDIGANPYGSASDSLELDGSLHTSNFGDVMSLSMGLGASDDSLMGSSDLHMSYTNPATGLPMVSDSTAGFDVGGNLYGFNNNDLSSAGSSFDAFGLGGSQDGFMGSGDIHMSYTNPATGLPMMSDSTAGFDVGGNPYGVDSNDLFGAGSSFDSFSSGSSSGSFGSGTDW